MWGDIPLDGYLWIGFVVLAFVAALVIEYYRRWVSFRVRVRRDWAAAEEMVRERNVPADQWGALQGVLKRYARRDPMGVLTSHRKFEACVEKEMARLTRSGNVKELKAAGSLLRGARLHLGLDFVPAGRPLESTRELSSGQDLWFSMTSVDTPQWTPARIRTVDEAYFHVRLDADKTVSGLRPGETVQFRLWREHDARYVFSSVLADHQVVPVGSVSGQGQATGNNESVHVWSFFHTRDLERLQLRTYYRVQYREPVVVGVLAIDKEAGANGSRNRQVTAKILGTFTSLSAGGFAATIGQTVHSNALLRIPLELPGEDPFEVNARVVAIDPKERGEYLLRGEFVNIPEDLRDTIARYVFHRQQPPYTETPESAALKSE